LIKGEAYLGFTPGRHMSIIKKQDADETDTPLLLGDTISVTRYR
jgi:hypothetical protein